MSWLCSGVAGNGISSEELLGPTPCLRDPVLSWEGPLNIYVFWSSITLTEMRAGAAANGQPQLLVRSKGKPDRGGRTRLRGRDSTLCLGASFVASVRLLAKLDAVGPHFVVAIVVEKTARPPPRPAPRALPNEEHTFVQRGLRAARGAEVDGHSSLKNDSPLPCAGDPFVACASGKYPISRTNHDALPYRGVRWRCGL